MDVFAAVSDFVGWFTGPRRLFIAAGLVAVGFFVFRMRNELSRSAIENTSVTVVFYVVNLLTALLFYHDLNVFAQSAYDALGIPRLGPDFWAGHLVWLGAVLAIVARDFCDYLIHRIMHTRWFWPTHVAHHTDTHVNAFTTFRVHIFESVLMSLTYIVILTWMQLPQLIPVMAFVLFTHNLYVHMDLDWDHGPFKYLLASPRFHRWHHADTPEAYGKNLANLMPVYDVIFGTYYQPGPCREKMGALASGLEDKNPIAMWFYPFWEWGRLIRDAYRKHGVAQTGQRGTGRAEYDPPPGE